MSTLSPAALGWKPGCPAGGIHPEVFCTRAVYQRPRPLPPV